MRSFDPKEIPKMIDILNEFIVCYWFKIWCCKCEMTGHRLILSIIGNKFIKKGFKNKL